MEAVVLMEAKESDREVFARMARDHHRMLLAYARALHQDEEEARELVQETLVAAWTNFQRFDVTRDTGAWLRGIVRNKWRLRCRQRGREPEFADGELGALEAGLAAMETGNDEALLEALRECRKKLPPAYGEAVRLYYDDGLDGAEAADRLQISAATLRKRLERARAALHKCLKPTL